MAIGHSLRLLPRLFLQEAQLLRLTYLTDLAAPIYNSRPLDRAAPSNLATAHLFTSLGRRQILILELLQLSLLAFVPVPRESIVPRHINNHIRLLQVRCSFITDLKR